MMKTTIGFVGMTHLGLVSASALASRGFKVICFDTDKHLISNLQINRLPITEPDLEELIVNNKEHQEFTNSITELKNCDLVYIAPDIPTDDQGQSDISGITDLIEKVLPELNPNSSLVILSQVEPGFTRKINSIEHARLYYQVETLIFGRAVERALYPERYIIGCADPTEPLNPHFAHILESAKCPILPMRYESAELAKISINLCLVSSISVANTLSELCEEIGADWSEIVPSLKLDKRIGQYAYLAPGLGIAGGNLERDLATVQRLGNTHQTDTGIITAWKENSRHRRDWAAQTIKSILLNEKPDATIAIWGLAYKENTHSIKNSPSLATISQLGQNTQLHLHDPVVSSMVVDHSNKASFHDPIEAVEGADALLILTPWADYKEYDVAILQRKLSTGIILDPYNVLKGTANLGKDKYLTLGR